MQAQKTHDWTTQERLYEINDTSATVTTVVKTEKTSTTPFYLHFHIYNYRPLNEGSMCKLTHQGAPKATVVYDTAWNCLTSAYKQDKNNYHILKL